MAEFQEKPKGSRPPDHRMLSRTLILLIVCGIAAFLVLIGKLYQIQIVKHELYGMAAVEQQVRETEIDSGRGSIYDRNGNVRWTRSTSRPPRSSCTTRTRP